MQCNEEGLRCVWSVEEALKHNSSCATLYHTGIEVIPEDTMYERV